MFWKRRTPMRLHSALFLFFFGLMFQLAALPHHPFVVITPEKTGTHLLTKAIGRIVEKEVRYCWAHILSKPGVIQELAAAENDNQFLHIHAFPTPEIVQTIRNRGYKVVFLIRDPRDTILSLYYYIEEGWYTGPLNLEKPYGQLSREDKIDELITGKRYRKNMVRALFYDRLPWMEQEPGFVYTARFENLVGRQGGGSNRAQAKEIIAIANHIECELSAARCKTVLENLWGPQEGQRTTFRKGVIGAWKTEFSENHKRVFQKKWGALLARLGYPPCETEVIPGIIKVKYPNKKVKDKRS